MKSIKNISRNILFQTLIVGIIIFCSSCDDSVLEEVPLSYLNSDAVLINDAGFQSYLVALSDAARLEFSMDSRNDILAYYTGTDIYCSPGLEFDYYKNYVSFCVPTSQWNRPIWDWAYTKMIMRANTVIGYAQTKEGVWSKEADKNAVIAEAKFYRAYTYNVLAKLYGGVPIVDTICSAPKYDFARASRQEVWKFVAKDLEFASLWLPKTVTQEGRIVKAAADHLLSEVYISLGEYDKAVASANNVIDCGLYHLMTNRFGSGASKPGDVFSDLFLEGNQNRKSGNFESIYVWQFEEYTPGGAGGYAGNHKNRQFAPFLTKVADPGGFAMLACDSLCRGVGIARGTNYMLYDLWRSDWNNDIRNSKYNMHRTFFWNNAKSPYYGKVVNPKTGNIDTLQNFFPYSRKVLGRPWEGKNTSGRIVEDVMVFRLAETYLLRAEAYFRKNMLVEAAADINVVRNRAKATPVSHENVNLDYILDERARELFTEEPRRLTLSRMGKMVERTRKYNLIESTRTSIQNYHELWPIPQSAIDANTGVVLEQNDGY